MSVLSKLCPKAGSTHRKKRVGRGEGSGKGGTSTKGHKGQKARTGGRVRWGFEGGQSPIMRRLPKFGFNNTKFRSEYEIVNVDVLNRCSGEVSPQSLYDLGLISSASRKVKVLGRGELKKSLKVKAHKFSEGASKTIQAAGGSVEVI